MKTCLSRRSGDTGFRTAISKKYIAAVCWQQKAGLDNTNTSTSKMPPPTCMECWREPNRSRSERHRRFISKSALGKIAVATQIETISENATSPSRYSGFDGQFIGGSWRAGRRGNNLKDTDPYTGEPIADIELANISDLDEAYQSAENAQPAWAELLP